MFDLNHGDMNAVLLGHAVAYNAPVIADVLARIDASLGTDDSAAALYDLAVAIGAPTDLAGIGMPEDGIDEAARHIVTEAAANVRPPDLQSIHGFSEDAYQGRTPTSKL